MKVDWIPLRAALRDLRTKGVALPIWWRDDDAIAPTAAFDQLVTLSEEVAVPVHVAVIPAHATSALAQRIGQSADVIPLVHGWAHVSHAPKGEKNAEFGHPRDTAAPQLTKALSTLQTLFGPTLLPVFVPPWNRISAEHTRSLLQAGYRGISTFGPRHARHALPGLVQVNTHIDPIDWRGTRDLVARDVMIARICEILSHRLHGTQDAQEPMGLLTHHLVHSDAIWSFSRQLLHELLDGGATPHPLPPLLEPPS